MAVIIQYVVERNGVEKMTFTNKKDADAYDKMLDIAELLLPFLTKGPIPLTDEQLEEWAFYLASNKDELGALLRGVTPSRDEHKKDEQKENANKLAVDSTESTKDASTKPKLTQVA